MTALAVLGAVLVVVWLLRRARRVVGPAAPVRSVEVQLRPRSAPSRLRGSGGAM